MNIALISIGNELLIGNTVNTNAAWIGQQVIAYGGRVSWHRTISDSGADILDALGSIPSKYPIIIITGGLGPTHDDVTAQVLYDFIGDTPVFDEEYWKLLERRFEERSLKLQRINHNQALRPQHGAIIPNALGSARGLHFQHKDQHIFALPGVPSEMKGMMDSTILPFIKEKNGRAIILKTIRTTGIMESTLAEKLADIVDKTPKGLNIAFLPKFTGVDICLLGQDQTLIDKTMVVINKFVKEFIYGYDEESLEEVVATLLKRQALSIATAESCTGGLISHKLTNVSGSSDYYVGGVVSYSNNVKIRSLHVQQKTLGDFGAVSPQTAVEMAKNVRKMLNADLGLAVTGIAGPKGGTEEKPVGLTYISLADDHCTIVKEFRFLKDRKINKDISCQAALNMVRRYCLK